MGWLKRQVTRAIAHGPAGIPNLTITVGPLGLASASLRNAFGLRPESKAYDQIGEDLGGPIATAFGYQRPYLRKGEDYPQKLSSETPETTEGQRKRGA